ncbi:hypothetical protein PF010_g24708 [Phytophthora fragariae]|uniref:Uncharacterized protein n=1 Tax=Phytophthora fragariae TaxID=53985 RepID=A0A6A4C1N1_9STRA|nr:hypothetical protein PF003_g36672 [Phytophthora fragariae]KAE8921705.1 hypothetical protein PF009_g28021 [Phytophthora fragariae]KAE9073325.1 hypothetical protein PF007_g25849 [Phytophthora fragariae]KAE9074355.1 hypothetical protein PF010_g24708 [Phytophthora fragariae]KAE9093987.1 hypothetical protein PF006_g24316 [Phytophthora fragariae]
MLSSPHSAGDASALAAAALLTSASLHKTRASDSRSSTSAIRCLAFRRERSGVF